MVDKQFCEPFRFLDLPAYVKPDVQCNCLSPSRSPATASRCAGAKVFPASPTHLRQTYD